VSLIQIHASRSRLPAWLGLIAILLLFIAPVISKSLAHAHGAEVPMMMMSHHGEMAMAEMPHHMSSSERVRPAPVHHMAIFVPIHFRSRAPPFPTLTS